MCLFAHEENATVMYVIEQIRLDVLRSKLAESLDSLGDLHKEVAKLLAIACVKNHTLSTPWVTTDAGQAIIHPRACQRY